MSFVRDAGIEDNAQQLQAGKELEVHPAGPTVDLEQDARTRLVESIREEGRNGILHVLGDVFVVHSSLLICSKRALPWLHLLASKLTQHMLHVLCNTDVDSSGVNALSL